MVFADLFFLYVFLPVCLIFYSVKKEIKYRNLVLIVFSLIFYAWGEPVWVFLLIFSASIDWLNGLIINKYRGKRTAKLAVAASLIINLGLLGLFKYSGFIVSNINAAFSLSLKVPDYGLPIGISFYTFQTISYTLDCYWDKVKVQKNYLNFLMYVSLFPQLVAGPIVRYGKISEEIENRKTSIADLDYGFTRIIAGLAKKVIIANNLSTIVGETFGGDIKQLTVIGTWYGVIAFALQIYFDFSGYSDIAIGLGRIFGFHFDENFNYPFVSKSITEYWQRWHISLGSFFRDYLFYLPIFGKRRIYLNLFLVWFCTGLWHGVSWNYIIWGLYFGLIIFAESKAGKKKLNGIPVLIRHIYTKIAIIIGFGIFYFEDFGNLLNFFKNLLFLNGNTFIDEITKVHIANNIYLLICAVILSCPVVKLAEKLRNRSAFFYTVISSAQIVLNAALLIISSIMLVNATNNPFLYFRF